MGVKMERQIKKQGGAVKWRNVPIKGHPGKFLKVAVTRKAGPRGGHTVAEERTKKSRK